MAESPSTLLLGNVRSRPSSCYLPAIKRYQVGRGSTTLLWPRNNLESQSTVMPATTALKAAQAVNFILVHGFIPIEVVVTLSYRVNRKRKHSISWNLEFGCIFQTCHQNWH